MHLHIRKFIQLWHLGKLFDWPLEGEEDIRSTLVRIRTLLRHGRQPKKVTDKKDVNLRPELWSRWNYSQTMKSMLIQSSDQRSDPVQSLQLLFDFFNKQIKSGSQKRLNYDGAYGSYFLIKVIRVLITSLLLSWSALEKGPVIPQGLWFSYDWCLCCSRFGFLFSNFLVYLLHIQRLDFG